MEEIDVYNKNLPQTIEDVSKFVLIGREKLNSVRAEIKAINKLNLAEEVRNQKKEEAQMLAEALLDAEVRLGQLFQALPKAVNQWKCANNSGVTSKNNNSEDLKNASRNGAKSTNEDFKNASDSGVVSIEEKEEWQDDSGVVLPKTKTEIIEDLGFTKRTAERFETLARNTDLVEQAKQEARANDDIVTRSSVLSLAKARKERQEQKIKEYEDFCYNAGKGHKIFNKLIDCLGFINRLDSTDIKNSMLNVDDGLATYCLEKIAKTKAQLNLMNAQLSLLEQEARKHKGVKLWEEN